MRAIVCRELGAPEQLVLEEAEIEPPRPGEVRIRVRACSINFPDLLLIRGQYQEKPELPFIPGGEVAGVVEDAAAAGPGMPAAGDPVMAITWRGGLAEYVNVPAGQVWPIPEGVSVQAAAGFPGVYGTAYHALKQRAGLRAGEVLLVLGAAGGVGLAAVQIGKALGARVIAAAAGEEKRAFLERSGADQVLDYGTEPLRDTVRQLTEERGADVIFDPVGGDFFDQAVRCVGWNGRILVVGFASGRIPRLPVNLALLKGMSIVGVFFVRFMKEEPDAARRNMRELAGLFADDRLHPHVHRAFPLEETAAAMNCLQDRQALGKVVVAVRAEQNL